MIGHGGPASTPHTRQRAERAALCALHLSRTALAYVIALATAVGLSESAPAQTQPSGESARLRIAWGGGEPTQWYGRIAIINGTLESLRLLSSNADSTGSIWQQDNEVRVASLSARQSEAIEVAVHAAMDSKLLIELAASAGTELVRTEVPLADLARGPTSLRLDERGNTLQVQNTIDPGMRIRFDRESLICAPGEQLSIDLQPTITGLSPGTTLDLQSTLSPLGSTELLWKDQQRLSVPVDGPLSVRLNIPIPSSEGVHTVRVAATRPPGFRERFFAGTAVPLAERSFHVVVVGTSGAAPVDAPKWETVLEIDPTNPRWWERLPSWTQVRRIPGLKSGPLGSIRTASVNHPFGRFVELPPTAAGSEPHWQAYSMPLEAVGVPHELEIQYPSDEEQHFGVSIIEPNATGEIEAVGLDTGVYVEGLGRSDAKQAEVHRVVFWPRTQAPLLLVTNRHPSAAAHFGHIRVRKCTASHLAAAGPRTAPGERLVAAYIDRGGDASEILGAGTPLVAEDSAPSFLALEHDWQPHYEGATRLTDYLRYAGFNGAIVAALGDGRSLYPSRLLLRGPAARGGAASTERTEVDALELLLRVFDREQLALLPAVQFVAPLPELEQLRRGSHPRSSGLEWVRYDGRTWREVYGSSQGRAPFYNLLDPRVQHAMMRVVAELIERYGHHPSLAGVTVPLASDGYAQLPPLDWGLDDATVARFEAETGATLNAEGANRFAARHAQLTGPYADAWRSWRAALVAEFYSQLTALVRAGNERRRLIVTTEHSLDHPRLAARVRPNILADNRVNATMLDLGIDRQRLRQVAGLALCETRFEGPSVPLRDRAVDLQINDAFYGRARETDAQAGAALFFHRTNRLRLTSFAEKGSFDFVGEPILASQPLPHGPLVRQPYAEALAGRDFATIVDGGQRLPLGQEELLRRVRLIFQQLPSAAQQTDVVRQPIFVRTYFEPNRTTLLVINTCPWPTDALVHLDVLQPAALEPLANSGGSAGGTSVASQPLAAGRHPWTVSLGPYEIQAAQIASGGVRVLSVQPHVSPAAKAELARGISDLSNRDTDPRVYRSLVNPSFEPIGGGALPGWQLVDNMGTATAELDASSPHDGSTCLYFRSAGQLAVLESHPFPTPDTGQLAVTAFIRGQNVGPHTELRMTIEADGAEYGSRSISVGGPDPNAYPLTDQWRPYPLLVNDLPLKPHGKMRIKFQFVGPGEVWLDEVKTYDLLFPLSFYKSAPKELLRFITEVQAAQIDYEDGKITDCVRRLEGYWPRFYASYTPPTTAQHAQRQPPKPADKLAAPAEPKQQPAPGFSDRLKWLVPFWR